MKLVIVESPAKAKTIEKYLGKDFTVRASVGHIRDLPKSNKDAVDVEGGFEPRYVVVKEKQKVIDQLEHEAKKADETILATDPDREGEAIAWHIQEVLEGHGKKTKGKSGFKRIAFNEITERAVQEALAHPRAVDMKLVRAQEARRVLDRLFGYDLSGLVWKKVRYGLSAGRVQSPALRILMEREREIRAFIPEKFWVVTAELKTEKNETFSAVCSEEPKNAEEADRIVSAARKGSWSVKSVEESEQSRTTRPPFTTSTLQQLASTRLGLSPSRTMGIAQKLYESGHITYMRTDSTNLAAEARANLISVISSEFGEKYVQARTFKTKSKSAQEAHEAIRPTNIKEGKIPDFSANGSRIIFDGWLAADPDARGEQLELPKVNEKDPLDLLKAESEGKETQPPSRYSEAGLVKELEKRGIGRPSTYATIIKTLADRGYVEKQGRTLMPTHTGDVVSSFIEKYFADYISDTFTAEMEDELDQIAEGKREYEKTLKDFYGPFKKAVKGKEKIPKITGMGDAPSEFPCPICGGPMEYKLSKTGRFMSCKKFPKCLGARREDGSEIPPPKEIGEACPQCKDGNLIEREGRYGRFIACSNYPKCKFVKKDPLEEERAKTGVQCPVCKKGEMMERRGRYGVFYSCSNYPECKNAIKAKPTGKICELCGSLMMEGTKTIPERCSNKACLMHNPHKLKK